ncbi:MAG: glucose-1-phosphate cytidylyltransferase [Pirellulales bacterium]
MTIDREIMPPAMILCGGQGTRIREVTESLPKPMVPVGPHPILWHVMQSYAAFGVKRFILCLGYKRENFIDYFMNFHARATDITLNLGSESNVTFHGDHDQKDWQVTLADTGEHTMTGARVARASKYLNSQDENFFLTYGDGVADINIDDLYDTHLKSQKALTITAVQPSSRFGEVSIEEGSVTAFQEKSPTISGHINGGFMAMRRDFVSHYLSTEESLVLENEPLQTATSRGEVSAYVHQGYWQCMDTPREHQLLNQLWESGQAPWTKYWSGGANTAGIKETDDNPISQNIVKMPQRIAA